MSATNRSSHNVRPEGGARCVSSARRDLYGGRLVTAVRTVTIGIGLEPRSGGRTLQVIGTLAARLKLIAEQFPMVPAAISLHRVGLIRRGCSLRANCFELGLLLVAQRSIEIIKC